MEQSLAKARPSSESKSAKNKEKHDQLFSHGNYHNYYSFRVQQIPDPRLNLVAGWFAGKAVLDLGCNAGKLTKEVVEHLGATSALGVDLDPVLIAQAESTSSPRGCTFKVQDFLLPGWCDGKQFDVVLLLSVTKWIHVNALDAGLLALFKDLHDNIMNADGVLIIEPQEWDNYKRAVRKAVRLRANFARLELRPPFAEPLRALGFVLVEEIEREEGGFSRPLHVWRKTISL